MNLDKICLSDHDSYFLINFFSDHKNIFEMLQSDLKSLFINSTILSFGLRSFFKTIDAIISNSIIDLSLDDLIVFGINKKEINYYYFLLKNFWYHDSLSLQVKKIINKQKTLNDSLIRILLFIQYPITKTRSLSNIWPENSFCIEKFNMECHQSFIMKRLKILNNRHHE